MKKILSIILLVCSSYLLRAQFSITQNLGSPNTLVKNPNYGGFQGGLIPFTFADTTAANLTNLKYYAGAYIYTSSPRATWWRDAAVSTWVQVLPGGGTGALGAWTTTLNTTIPTDLSLNGYFGTTAANGIGFYTTNTQRVILPAGGLTLKAVVSDTTLNKPMVWNTSTKEWNYGYWYGGSGATPTWQQTLTAGSTLTGDNTVNGGGFDFSLNNIVNYELSVIAAGTISLNGGDVGLYGVLNGRSNNIVLSEDTMHLQPSLGLIVIDTLNNASTQNQLMGWTSSGGDRGGVGYITVGSGLSLSGGALSATATTPTWQQTLTAGSTLTGANTIAGGGFDFTWNNAGTYSLTGSGNYPFKIIGANGGGIITGGFNSTFGGLWSNNVTPSTLNYALVSDGSSTILNTTGSIDLAVNSTSAMRIRSNGNVGIGAGTAPGDLLTLGTAGSVLGVISLAGSGSGKITIKPQNAAGTWTMTLPTTDGNSGEFLQTDGSGVTSWAAPSGGSLTSTYIGYGSAGNTLTGDANLTYTAASSAVVIDSGYLSFTGHKAYGSTVAGSIFKHSDYGLTTRAITGSTYDWLMFSTGGNTILANPTGTDNFLTSGKFGFGSFGLTPSALVNIAAGTATANTAPLKFTSGTNLTTAEAGAVEYNGSNFFMTATATNRRQVALSNVATPTSGYLLVGNGTDWTITAPGSVTGLNYISALTNGNGTTANGTAVDLGGTVSSGITLDASDATDLTFVITNNVAATNAFRVNNADKEVNIDEGATGYKVGIRTSAPDSVFTVDGSGHFTTNVAIDGKLTVAGAIDPTHLYLDEQSGNPGGTANKGVLYTKDVSTVTELFYQASDGTVTQLTPGGGGMVYPGAGIAVSTGSAWTTSITDNSANWNTAYTDRMKWDGGSTGLTASTGRTSLGGTTIGQNIFTSTNPSAITFLRGNADNTVDWLSASSFRSAIGAGTGDGTVTAIGVTTANGVSGSSSGGSTPNLTISLGAITPTSVNGVVISGSSTPTLAVTGTTTVSGSNTGDQNLFSNIPVSGQTTVTASSATTALTFVAGSNMTITTDNTAKSITFASSGGSGSPGGSTTQVQYNNAGAFGGISGATTNGTTMTLTTPVLTGLPTGTGVASASTASTLASRDANGNTSVNNLVDVYTSTATAAGTTTLTVSSKFYQNFSGTSTQTVTLPDATTLTNGHQFFIMDNSTGNLTVNMNGGTLLKTVPANQYILVTLTNNGTAAGTWTVQSSISQPEFIRQSATYALSNTTNIQKLFDASTNGALTVKASTTYMFEGIVNVSGMSATSGNMKFDILGAGTATLTSAGWSAIGLDNTTVGTAAAHGGSYTATNVSSGNITTAAAGTAVYARVKGIFTVNAGGTIIPSVGLTTAVGTAVVGVNTWMMVTEILPAGTNYTSGWN